MIYSKGMTEESIKHTIILCQHLYKEMPPLVPKEVKTGLEQALVQMKNNVSLTGEEVEGVMVFFGKQMWPYREAYKEFFAIYEGLLGEKYLVRSLSLPLKTKYSAYKEQGGSFQDLHSGKNVSFFTHDERVEFAKSLVQMEQDIEAYTRQTVVSADKNKYEQRIKEFSHILNDIEMKLRGLREMANSEGDHPELVTEIEQQIRGFEHGLCLLGPKTHYEEVLNAEEHFRGRRTVIALHKTVL